MSQETRSNGNFSVITNLREKELLYVVEKSSLAFVEQIRTMYGSYDGFFDVPCCDLARKEAEKGVGMNDIVGDPTIFTNDFERDGKHRKDSFGKVEKGFRSSASENAEFSIEKDFVRSA